MKKGNLFVALGLTALLSTGIAMPALAAQLVDAGSDPETATVTTDRDTAEGTKTQGTVAVSIEAQQETLSVTIPTKLPITFEAGKNGVATVPTNFSIKNNSSFEAIQLNKLSLKQKSGATTTDWRLSDSDITTPVVDDRLIRFKAKGNGATGGLVGTTSSEIDFTDSANASSILKVAKSGSGKLDFEVKGSQFKSDVALDANAFTMNLDFGWATS